jgi:hypothetical protein
MHLEWGRSNSLKRGLIVGILLGEEEDVLLIILIILLLVFGFGGYRLGPGIGYYPEAELVSCRCRLDTPGL